MFGELHLFILNGWHKFSVKCENFSSTVSVCPSVRQAKPRKTKICSKQISSTKKVKERKEERKKENKKQLSKFMWVWRNKEEKRKLVFALCDLCLFFRSCKVCDRCKTKSYVFLCKSYKLKSKFWLLQGKTFLKWSILNGSVYFVVKTALGTDTERKRCTAKKELRLTLPWPKCR